MNKLIKISTNEEGKQLVSARELYLGLGLNKTQWSRWYPKNIEKNEYFTENIDFIGVRHNVESSRHNEENLGGRPTLDFAISLDFAKHIAMMARTEKSHEYRNYFLECEKQVKEGQSLKQLTPMEILELQFKALNNQEAKLDDVDFRLKKVENNTTIDYSQQLSLNELAHKKVVSILGGKDTPAYKELNKRAFSLFWKDFKRIVQVNSYRNTLVKDYDFARKVIIDWQPNRELELMIKGCNSQIRM